MLVPPQLFVGKELKHGPQKSPLRACTIRKASVDAAPSHQVSSDSLINCRKCHSAKCFSHILANTGIHSSAALMVHASDSTHHNWHKFHVDNKNDYAGGYLDLVSAMKQWSHHDLNHRLVYFAMNFKPPRLVNTEVLSGFYDVALPNTIKVRILITSSTVSHSLQQRQSSKASITSSTSVAPPPKKAPMLQGRITRSMTPSMSSHQLSQTTNKKRARTPNQDTEESVAEDEKQPSKRPRVRTQKVGHKSNPGARLSKLYRS